MEDSNIENKTDKELVLEYVKRLHLIENEMSILKDDKKQLDEEFKERIDLKTLKKVLRALKIMQDVEHKATFEEWLDVLEKESLV